MPTLRQITCAIELGPGNTRLKEYKHKVTDGAVETYIAAPETDIPFHVRVTSDGYIAPGLAAYVFMDGEYQCNRNRLRLRLPEDGVGPEEYEVNFKLRQKEEKTSDGTFIARDWFFTPLNTGNADKASSTRNFKDNVGTIEVVILRCKEGGSGGGGGEELATDPAQTTVSMNPPLPVRSVRVPAVRVASSRAPSATKPLPYAPSAAKPLKQSSAGGSGMMGGLFGIFDGAGDDSSYYSMYRPNNLVGQEHLPGHRWDPRTGQYRYFKDQDPFVNSRDQEDRNVNTFPPSRYRPQTYTVGGDFSYVESAAPEAPRPSGPKTFVPQTSPGYDFTSRRRKIEPREGSEEAPTSTYDFTRRRTLPADVKDHDSARLRRRSERRAEPEDREEKPERQQRSEHRRDSKYRHESEDSHGNERTLRSEPRRDPEHRREREHGRDSEYRQRPERRQDSGHRRESEPRQRSEHRRDPEHQQHSGEPGRGFAFVDDSAGQMTALFMKYGAEAEKYNALIEDAARYQDRPEIHDNILKAAQRKHEELAGYVTALGDLYRIVKATLDDMDRPTWRLATDLLYDKGLYPPPALDIGPPPIQEVEQKPPPGAWPVANETWEQVGEGKAEGNSKDIWGNPVQDPRKSTMGSSGKKASWFGSAAKSKEGEKDEWGNAVENKPPSASGGWANTTENKPPSGDDGWPTTAEKKAASGWGGSKRNKTPTIIGGWDTTGDAAAAAAPGGDEWGNSGDQSKPADNSWDKPDSNDNKPAATGWANDDATKNKPVVDAWETTKPAADGADDWGTPADKKKSHGGRSRASSKSYTYMTGTANDGAGSDSHAHGDPQPKPVIKPYWSDWTKRPEMAKPKARPRDVYEYPAPPVPSMPSGTKDIHHAVHAGRGANYAHRLHRPDYLDSMAKPYAIFTFKYRSKAVLESMLKTTIDDANIQEAKAEAKKHRLLSLGKDDLVEELMKKSSIAAKSKAASKTATAKVDEWGNEVQKSASKASAPKVEGWGNEPSKPSSRKARSPSKSQSKKDKAPSWDAKPAVGPNDSVSQAGWGKAQSHHTAKTWGHQSTKPANNGWPGEDKKDGKSKATHASLDWGSTGSASTKTVEHFPGADLNTTKRGGPANGGW